MSIVRTLSAPPLWLLFVLAGLAQFSENVYSPALPDIARSLQASNDLVQWTLSVYFVGFAAGVFIWGRISDHWGRRRTMLLAIAVYILGSVLCLLSNQITWLLFSRLIQGFGISSGSVLTQTIARESLQEKKRHMFFSSVGFVIAFSIAMGPFIGGYLTQWFTWRANFFLLFLIGVLVLFLVFLVLPETCQKSHLSNNKLGDVFLLLIKDKYVWGCACLVAAVNGILFSYYAEGPFIFIQLIKLSASEYGWLGSAVALAALFGSLYFRKIMTRFSHAKLISIGCWIMSISSFFLVIASFSSYANSSHPIIAITIIMLPMMGIIFGGFGFVVPMALSTALQKYQSVLGTAGALFGLLYYIMISILTWIMGVIHNGQLQPMPIYFLTLTLISLFISSRWIQNR